MPMSAALIDGKAISAQLRAQCRAQVSEEFAPRGIVPGLAVVLVGENPASRVYVRNKIAACAEVGIVSRSLELPDTLSEAELLAKIAALNADPAINGILVQLPLPKHIAVSKVLKAIDPDKDVDGFNLENVGGLVTGERVLEPCTPAGCIKMLEMCGIAIEGKHAVIVGRSNIVGKPVAMMLLARGATVSICHSKTRDLGAMTRQGDILVAAVGVPKMIKGSMVKPGAVVLDVGINRMSDGKLCGDVDFDEVRNVAAHITPVPGGVGPMTIAMLMFNTVLAARRAHGLESKA
jgi:methylenetetrahydrofolate dehydrogenase (NADP+)/methenyltetrahydrofolate cyclohydrolase